VHDYREFAGICAACSARLQAGIFGSAPLLVVEGAIETPQGIETLVMEFSPALLKDAGGNPESTLRILTGHFSRIYRSEGAELVRVEANDCLRSGNQMDLVFER
jgi:hypothetical protein